jgi:hypothetical protein
LLHQDLLLLLLLRLLHRVLRRLLLQLLWQQLALDAVVAEGHLHRTVGGGGQESQELLL